MAFSPAPTSGIGVAAQIKVQGNETPLSTKPGYNNVTLSISGANGFPETFQLNPQVVDAAGTAVPAGTALVLTAAATAAAANTFTLTAAASASGGTTVYTGTITGGGSNAFAGRSFTIAGFVTAANNGTFIATASSATTLTLENAVGAAETHAGTATDTQLVTAYTGTITGGGSNALVGLSFNVAGFVTAANNGSFIATASSTTVLTLANAAGVSETHAATATAEDASAVKFVAYGAKSLQSGTAGKLPASASATPIVTVSSTGLVTAVTPGETTVEASYPTFNNAVGNIVSSGNVMNGLPINKIYAEVDVTVVP